MADDIGQIAQHQVVVVWLGVEEARAGKGLAAPLDLADQAGAHHVRQGLNRFGAPLHKHRT